jgi:hypothetical protein
MRAFQDYLGAGLSPFLPAVRNKMPEFAFNGSFSFHKEALLFI